DGLRSLEGSRALVVAGLVRGCPVGRLAPQHRTRRCQAHGRSRVHGAGNLRQAWNWLIVAWRSHGLLGRRRVDVGEALPLHSVKMIEIAPKFVETVGRRQSIRV